MEGAAIIGEPGVRPVNPGASPFEEAGGVGRVRGRSAQRRAVRLRHQGNCFEMPAGDQPPAGQAIEVRLVALTGDVRQFRPYRSEAGQWLDFASPPSLAPRHRDQQGGGRGLRPAPGAGRDARDGATANATPQVVGVIDDGGVQPTAYVRADELVNWCRSESLGDGSSVYGITVLLRPAAADIERTLRAKLAGAGLPAEPIHMERSTSASGWASS